MKTISAQSKSTISNFRTFKKFSSRDIIPLTNPLIQVRGDLPGQHTEVLLVDDRELAGQGTPGHTQGGRTLHLQGTSAYTDKKEN